jgi:hypothetical protein
MVNRQITQVHGRAGRRHSTRTTRTFYRRRRVVHRSSPTHPALGMRSPLSKPGRRSYAWPGGSSRRAENRRQDLVMPRSGALGIVGFAPRRRRPNSLARYRSPAWDRRSAHHPLRASSPSGVGSRRIVLPSSRTGAIECSGCSFGISTSRSAVRSSRPMFRAFTRRWIRRG